MADDAVSVTGLAAILRKLEYLDTKGANKVLTAMIRAQMTVIAKQMKADVSPRVKDGRRAIRSRFKNNRKKNWVMAKVGFHVGKRVTAKTRIRTGRAGVGISANNIHWWVAGTAERHTGGRLSRSKSKKHGTREFFTPNGKAIQSRGRMPSMQPRLAAIAATKSKGKQNAYMIKMGALRLEKELAVMRAMK